MVLVPEDEWNGLCEMRDGWLEEPSDDYTRSVKRNRKCIVRELGLDADGLPRLERRRLDRAARRIAEVDGTPGDIIERIACFRHRAHRDPTPQELAGEWEYLG
jgi:hypothetical protein